MPRWTPPQDLLAPIWAIHHHQGYWGQCLQAQYSTIPWSAPSVQCGPPSALLSTSTRHIRCSRTTHTNRFKPRLHGASHNWSDYGHTNQEHPLAKDPAISSCQSRPTPSSGKVTHQGPSSAEVSSSHGGTQRNGDHCFLRGEEWSGGYWWPPTYSTWTPTIISFSFPVSLIVAQLLFLVVFVS